MKNLIDNTRAATGAKIQFNKIVDAAVIGIASRVAGDPDRAMHHGEEIPLRQSISVEMPLDEVQALCTDIGYRLGKMGLKSWNALIVERALLGALFNELVGLKAAPAVLEVIQHYHHKVCMQFDGVIDRQPDLLEQQQNSHSPESSGQDVKTEAPAAVAGGGASDLRIACLGCGCGVPVDQCVPTEDGEFCSVPCAHQYMVEAGAV